MLKSSVKGTIHWLIIYIMMRNHSVYYCTERHWFWRQRIKYGLSAGQGSFTDTTHRLVFAPVLGGGGGSCWKVMIVSDGVLNFKLFLPTEEKLDWQTTMPPQLFHVPG